MNSIHENFQIPLDFAKPTPYQQLELARAILKFYEKHFCICEDEDDDSSQSQEQVDKSEYCTLCGVGANKCREDTCETGQEEPVGVHSEDDHKSDKSSVNESSSSLDRQCDCPHNGDDAQSGGDKCCAGDSPREDNSCCIFKHCQENDDDDDNDSDDQDDIDSDDQDDDDDNDDSDSGDDDSGDDDNDDDQSGDGETCDSVYTSDTETGSSNTMLVFWGPTHAWLKNMSLTYNREYSYHPCLLDLVTRVSCLEVEECKIARLLNLLSTEFPLAQVVWLYESHNLRPSWPLGYGLYHRDACTQHQIIHLDGNTVRVMDTLTGSTISEEHGTVEELPDRLLKHNLSVFATGHWALDDESFHQLCQSCASLAIVRLRREQEIVYEKVAINYVMQFLKKYRGLHVPDECIAIRCTDTETLLCAIQDTM